MLSLANARGLLGVSDHRKSQSARELQTALRSLVPLEIELTEIEQQALILNELLETHHPEDQRLSHVELFALLRRQAVIRRQIDNLALERARVIAQRGELAEVAERLRLRQKLLQMKHLKYVNLEQRLLGDRRSFLRRQEENEIEELLVNIK